MPYGTYDPGLTAFAATAEGEEALAASAGEWALLSGAFLLALITLLGVL